MSIREKIDDKYKTLVARLGDLHFRRTQLDRQIKDLEDQVDALSKVAPLLSEDENEEPQAQE